jgi:hypothetical protein
MDIVPSHSPDCFIAAQQGIERDDPGLPVLAGENASQRRHSGDIEHKDSS